MSKKKQKEIELQEINILLKIPKDAVSLEIRAGIVRGDEKLTVVKRNLSVQDIFLARQAFLENVEDGDDYDARYVLTDQGREYLERLAENGE